METDTNTQPTSVPNRLQSPVTDDKRAIISMLRDEGMSTKAIAQALGLSPNTIYKTDEYIRKTQNKGLLSESRVKKASKVVDRLIDGKAWGDIKDIKDSTALRAAEVVLDRAYPKAQDSAPSHISFTNINLNMVEAPSQVLDITKDIYPQSGYVVDGKDAQEVKEGCLPGGPGVGSISES